MNRATTRVLALAACGGAAGLMLHRCREPTPETDTPPREVRGRPNDAESRPSAAPRLARPYTPRLDGALPSLPGRPSRPTVDTTERSPLMGEQARDPAWANPMEEVVIAHAKKNLADFLPDATWGNAACMTTTCALEFTFPDGDAEFASVVAPFIAGPFRRSRDVWSDGAGRSTMRITVSYVERDSGTRLDPSRFGEALDRLPPQYVEWRERIRSNLAAAKAEVEAAAGAPAP